MTEPAPDALIRDLLPPEARLALVWTPPHLRARLGAVLALDQRLAQIVARTREPLLGQMRLAWWRDALGQAVADRPRGDAVLDALGREWVGREAALLELIAGWEHVLEEPPLTEHAAQRFAAGRCAVLLSAHEPLAGRGGAGSEAPALGAAAARWSFADFAARVSRADEREMLVRLGCEHIGQHARLPREARGLAVLGALGARALLRGGQPLLEGRGAALVALRAGLSGR